MKRSHLKNKILDFFSSERKTLVGYVRRFIDDTADRDGEDIVQDVALNIFNRADITVPIENVAAYVYQALRNRAVDYIRKKRDTVSLDDGRQDEEDSLFHVLPVLQIDPSDEISTMEAREILFKALLNLKKEEREIIIAVELEGKTFREIAEESGLPLGTLLARKSRAMKKIKEFYHD